MALRLNVSAVPSAPSGQSAQPATNSPTVASGVAAQPSVHPLVAKGLLALQAKDIATWRQIFASAADLETAAERYDVRCALISEVLQNRSLPLDGRQLAFAACAAGLVDVLEVEPREPKLLNWLGMLLWELGETRASRAAFMAADRLDPEVPGLAINLREVKRRSKSDSVALQKSMLPAVQREMNSLKTCAERAVAKAHPRFDQTLTVGMIVKNEQEMLPQALQSIVPWADELIVVDTGSTDKTVEIAEAFGAKVLHFPWIGDFSAARNVSMDAATGDWFLYLDADEVLVEEDGPKLEELLTRTWREAASLVFTNYTGSGDQGVSVNHDGWRLFRNRPEYRFEGAIHEQIAHCVPQLPERMERTDIRIEHYGYTATVRDDKSKSSRNLEILLNQVAQGVDNGFVHFNLGTEYVALHEFETGRTHFARALELMNGDPDEMGKEYFPMIILSLITCSWSLGLLDEALGLARSWAARWPDFTDLVTAHAGLLAATGQLEEAETIYQQALALGPKSAPYWGAQANPQSHTRGAYAGVLSRMGRHQDAAKQLHEALALAPARIDLQVALTETRLAAGSGYDEIRPELDALVGGLSSQGLFSISVPFYERGEIAVAEQLLRESLALRPGVPAVSLALVEALLSRSAYVEACAEAAHVAPTGALGQAVARSYLFAAFLSSEQQSRLPEAVEYAKSAGLARAELDLYRAWESGQAAPNSLDAAVADELANILGGLAQLQEFDQFGRLAVVSEGLDLPWRERRELLASVYFERGFLESAADEWITVVETQGPDARALYGLARVADLRDMPEDAENLLAAARELLEAEQRAS